MLLFSILILLIEFSYHSLSILLSIHLLLGISRFRLKGFFRGYGEEGMMGCFIGVGGFIVRVFFIVFILVSFLNAILLMFCFSTCLLNLV